jgi:drug/metabolite transporter (DMT)-like permease
MPPAALLLVLGAAVCHSTWNLLIKTEPRRLEIQSGAIIVGTLLCAPVLFVYPLGGVPARAWALMLVSGVLETSYVFALSAAYGAGDLSLVYPVARGIAPVLVTPLAVAFLGERLSAPGLGGIGLVVVGIFMSHGATGRGWTVARADRRALGLAVLTGVFTCGYSLVNKLGVRLVPVPLYAFLVFLVDAALIHLAQWVRGGGAPPIRRDAPWGRIVVVGVLMMSAYVAVLGAMALAPVSYVVAARETSIVVAAVLGALVLRERHSAVRIAGSVVIFAGLVVIALAR